MMIKVDYYNIEGERKAQDKLLSLSKVFFFMVNYLKMALGVIRLKAVSVNLIPLLDQIAA